MSAKKILINSRAYEEIRIAIIEKDYLINLYIESKKKSKKKGNIYKAVVSHVEPSLDAIFVDYGEKINGFLSIKEIAKHFFISNNNNDWQTSFKKGKEILVQIQKEERGGKGASVSTFITLTGCYLVLMPYNPNVFGISRHISGQNRIDIKKIFKELNLPKDFGIIFRTDSVGKKKSELQWEINILIYLWESIKKANFTNKAPCLIYQENDIIYRTIRDILKKDIKEIIVDSLEMFISFKDKLKYLKPDFIKSLQLYEHEKPLFYKYHIENQIESIYQRKITLLSGASVFIDVTEALIAIDVNSGKATKGININQTALSINLEATKEIARQLRFRDLGGLIVIDFIDMNHIDHKKQVEDLFVKLLKLDRAHTKIGNISCFGLLEMTRQRIGSSLQKTINVCSTCNGYGYVPSKEFIGNRIFQKIQMILNKKIMDIKIISSISVVNYISNNKKYIIHKIEKKYNININILADQNILFPNFKIFKINPLKNKNFFYPDKKKKNQKTYENSFYTLSAVEHQFEFRKKMEHKKWKLNFLFIINKYLKNNKIIKIFQILKSFFIKIFNLINTKRIYIQNKKNIKNNILYNKKKNVNNELINKIVVSYKTVFSLQEHIKRLRNKELKKPITMVKTKEDSSYSTPQNYNLIPEIKLIKKNNK